MAAPFVALTSDLQPISVKSAVRCLALLKVPKLSALAPMLSALAPMTGTHDDQGALIPLRMGSNDRRIDGNQEK